MKQVVKCNLTEKKKKKREEETDAHRLQNAICLKRKKERRR